MFGIGIFELLVILAVAVIALGPNKLPQTIVDIVKFFRAVKKTMAEAKDTFDKELQLSELKEEALKYKQKIEGEVDKLTQDIKLDELREMSVEGVAKPLEEIRQKLNEPIEYDSYSAEGHSALSGDNSSLGNHLHNPSNPAPCGARQSAPQSQGGAIAQSNTANTRIVCGEVQDSKAFSESTLSDFHSLQNLESKADSEPTPAVGHSSTAIESSFSSEPCSEQALKASSGRGDCQGGRERLRNSSPSPLDEKENTTDEVLESKEVKSGDSEKLDSESETSKIKEAKTKDSQAKDSESKTRAESAMALDSEKQDSDSKNLESATDSESQKGIDRDSKGVDCHADKSARNDDKTHSQADSKNADPHTLLESHTPADSHKNLESHQDSQQDSPHA